MRIAILVAYATIFAVILALQLWGVTARRTATLGDVVGMLVRARAVRWLLISAWLWWGWHVFVRVHL